MQGRRGGLGSGFARLWTASTLSAFGTAVTTVALPVLVVRTLQASPAEVGLVNAAQFLPYAVLGLLAGALVDRTRRRPVLVWGSLGRAVTLGAVPVLALLGLLQTWSLVVLLLAFGSCSVFAAAAAQSLLPRVVPRDRLVVANARLDQGDAAAQSTGPALGGGLVALVGAPVAIAVDALSYLLDAALVSRMAVDEPRPARAAGRSLSREIGEGLRWTYRHRLLGPLALSTHVWFLANGAAFTALSLLALRDLGLSTAAVLLAAGLALHGAAGSVENAHDTGLWQRITPDHLLGRANATRRSVNRSLGAVGALLGGVAVGLVGERPTLVAVVATYAVSAAVVAASPLRHVRHDDPS